MPNSNPEHDYDGPPRTPSPGVRGMEHNQRGSGHCVCIARLLDCPKCGGKKCVHHIFATGELFCENGAEHGCNRVGPQ